MKLLRSRRHAWNRLPIVCAFLVCAIPLCSAAQTKREKPVAVFGNQAVYEKDYLPRVQSQLDKLRNQEYELKLKALKDVIDERLLKAEAQKRGISEKELLRQEVDSKVAPMTQEQRDQAIAARLFGGTAMSGEDLDKDLKKERLEKARQAYFEKLRRQAGVNIYLLPPRVPVTYDPARVRGNPNAKITIVEFSDFQCPFCLQAYTTVKDLLKKYDGKVKLAYRDLPLIGVPKGVPGSAEAARCAGAQGKFWPYHDLLFENQDRIDESAFLDYAADLKLDMHQFKSCLDSRKYKPEVERDFREGIRLGLTGTPGFFINGVMVKGAQPESTFEHIINTELYLMHP